MMAAMRRRDRGDGYLARKPRRDGRWRASYVGSDGKRHDLHGRTRAEAKAKLGEALTNLRDGLYVAGPSQTVRQFLAVWLSHKTDLAPRTRERYAGLIRLHINPAIGEVELRKLTSQRIAQLYFELGATQSASSIGQVHAVLHGALAQAKLWRAIAASPVGKDAGVVAPKPQRRELRFFDAAQVRTLLDAARGDPLEALVVTAVYTGLRLGELLALRWGDVDLDERMLTVHHTLTREAGAWVLRQPKTARSRRTVRLASAALDALRAHRLAEAERLLSLGHRLEPGTLVFSDRWGDAVNVWHVTERAFKPLLRRAGLPELRFHDLRHAFASLMLSEGARVEVVSKMLGHASPAITLSIYAHILPGDEEAAVDRLQRRIGGA